MAPGHGQEENRDPVLNLKELNSAHHHVNWEEDAELQKGMQPSQHLDYSVIRP